jgi:hypothetical protein
VWIERGADPLKAVLWSILKPLQQLDRGPLQKQWGFLRRIMQAIIKRLATVAVLLAITILLLTLSGGT